MHTFPMLHGKVCMAVPGLNIIWVAHFTGAIHSVQVSVGGA
jgi:hypothetical protein